MTSEELKPIDESVLAANKAWVDYEPPKTALSQTHLQTILTKHAFVAGYRKALDTRPQAASAGLVEALEAEIAKTEAAELSHEDTLNHLGAYVWDGIKHGCFGAASAPDGDALRKAEAVRDAMMDTADPLPACLRGVDRSFNDLPESIKSGADIPRVEEPTTDVGGEVESWREKARALVAEHYGYKVVENVSLHCTEVHFALIGYKAALASRTEPKIEAIFETPDGEVMGQTSAKVKRVERQDDGSLTVVIDHWPASHTNGVMEGMEKAVEAVRGEWLHEPQDESDQAYLRGLEHAITAIRAAMQGEASNG